MPLFEHSSALLHSLKGSFGTHTCGNRRRARLIHHWHAPQARSRGGGGGGQGQENVAAAARKEPDVGRG